MQPSLISKFYAGSRALSTIHSPQLPGLSNIAETARHAGHADILAEQIQAKQLYRST
jgi:Protein of unknown function (DUF664)